jgi:hypothetical protein
MIEAIDPATTWYLAQQVNTTGLRDWLLDNVVVIGIVLVVLAGIFASLKGQAGKVMTISALVMAPLALLGLVMIPNGPQNVGKFLISLLGIG